MATISNIADVGANGFAEHIRSLSDDMLVAQDLVQQGGVYAIAFLIQHGCDEGMAVEMLANMREQAQLIRDEAVRRGNPSLFAADQTGFC